MWTNEATLAWFLLAGIAIWSGTAILQIWNARRAARIPSSERSSIASMDRRLTDCETLLSELVQALSRIEARDKMRQVRAARTAKEDAAKASSTETSGQDDAFPSMTSTTAKIPTAELRRQIALRNR